MSARLAMTTREIAEHVLAFGGDREQQLLQAERLLEQFIRGERDGYAQLVEALAMELSESMRELDVEHLLDPIREAASGIRAHGSAWHLGQRGLTYGPAPSGTGVTS